MKSSVGIDGGGAERPYVTGRPEERLRQLLNRPLRSMSGYRLEKGARVGNLEREALADVQRILDTMDPVAAARFYTEAYANPEKMRSLSALRTQQFSSYVNASLNFAARYYEVVNLAADERPVIQEVLPRNEVAFGYVGQDGNARRMKVMPDSAETLLPMKFLNSEVLRYRLVDIYNGNAAAAAVATVDLASDSANKIDALAYTLLTASLSDGGVFGNFTVTGNKVNRVYLANSRVQTGNLPTSNDLSCSNNSGSTKFRLEAFKKAMNYCDRWAGCFSDGDLRPTGFVLLPSGDATDLADEITPTTTSIAASTVQENLLHNYTRVNYLGVNWTLIPDNTLSDGKAYFILNKPVGFIYRKPSLDMEVTETNRHQNWEERFMKTAIGLFIPTQRRMNALRVTYRT